MSAPPTAAEEPKVPVRLTGSSNPKQGRVEVFERGIWGHVARLTNNGAIAVCRELFGPGMRVVVTSQPLFAPDVARRGVVWRDSDYCSAEADSFLSCASEPSRQWSWETYTSIPVWSTGNPIYQVACYSRSGEAA